jgi:hypothetical protein
LRSIRAANRRSCQHVSTKDSQPPERTISFAEFEASSLQADRAKGFLAGHPVLHLVFDGHLLVGAKLLIQVSVDLFLSEK